MMTTSIGEQIGEILSQVGARDVFSAKQTRGADDLHLEVKGIGRIRFPVSIKQAKQLCGIGRPARFGKREKTLLDTQVRDTWEIPKSRVKIDLRRWKQTLLPVLDRLRADLGLPEGGRLKAELHAMLVYAPGQFFLPHQDSEKSDDMVGTLVVTLPSSFQGGALVVEHQGEKATYRGSKKYLSFVAFYADCQHEVRPVKKGYRIALTYNLMLERAGSHVAGLETAPEIVDALVDGLRQHFETPRPSSRTWDKDAPLEDPPNRLVYLLDHQYTERGFGWQRLKGKDIARSAALAAAAERYGCERMLALAEVHETWSCMEPDDYGYRGGYGRGGFGRHRSWQRDEDDEWVDEDPPVANDPDAYELGERIDSDIALTRWIDASGAKVGSMVSAVGDDEVCATTPSSDLEAHESEYEGYMGNYGNTMERWYRRAAIVLWPRQRAFAMRAEASPARAVETLVKKLRSKADVSEAQAMARSLLPFWSKVAPEESRKAFFPNVLDVAEALGDPALAKSLLQPFRMEALAPARAPAFVALVKRYGMGWTRSLLAEWADRSQWHVRERDSFAWIGSLPRLARALCKVSAPGERCAKLLVEDRWRWVKKKIEGTVGIDRPSWRNPAMVALARPVLGILESSEILGMEKLRDQAVAFLCASPGKPSKKTPSKPTNEPLFPCLVQILRAADKRKTLSVSASPGLSAIRKHCLRLLEARLARPARDPGDWSIDLADDCRCNLCAKLRGFLSDPAKQHLEWPLAKGGRQHVHQVLDGHELPVTHKTRRSGSPYTLVLAKTTALFEREAKERRAWQSDLDGLLVSR